MAAKLQPESLQSLKDWSTEGLTLKTKRVHLFGIPYPGQTTVTISQRDAMRKRRKIRSIATSHGNTFNEEISRRSRQRRLDFLKEKVLEGFEVCVPAGPVVLVGDLLGRAPWRSGQKTRFYVRVIGIGRFRRKITKAMDLRGIPRKFEIIEVPWTCLKDNNTYSVLPTEDSLLEQIFLETVRTRERIANRLDEGYEPKDIVRFRQHYRALMSASDFVMKRDHWLKIKHGDVFGGIRITQRRPFQGDLVRVKSWPSAFETVVLEDSDKDFGKVYILDPVKGPQHCLVENVTVLKSVRAKRNWRGIESS